MIVTLAGQARSHYTVSTSRGPADEELQPPDPAGVERGVAAEPTGPDSAPARTGSGSGSGSGEQLGAAPPVAANMLPGRAGRRWGLERLLVRFIATCGIIGIGVAIGAILISQHVQGWITGLVVSAVSVLLSALLWSSRQL